MDLRLKDGSAIVKDSRTGYYCYAALSDDGQSLVSTGMAAAGPSAKYTVQNTAVSLPQEVIASITDDGFTALESLGQPPAMDGLKMAGDGEYFYDAIGAKNGLVLLVYFLDDPDGSPDQGEGYLGYAPSSIQFGEFCNFPGYEEDGMNGSVMDYFDDVSITKLAYTQDISGYYVTDHNQEYYEEYSKDDHGDGNNCQNSCFQRTC